jgi:hypothetical protein
VPTPEPQPKFFLDRSLGRVAVPALLRAAGWNLVTLAEHYGVPEDEQVADTTWIQDAATCGWPILMKDKRIRYRRAEIDAVIQYQAQCFVMADIAVLRAEPSTQVTSQTRIGIACDMSQPKISGIMCPAAETRFPCPDHEVPRSSRLAARAIPGSQVSP